MTQNVCKKSYFQDKITEKQCCVESKVWTQVMLQIHNIWRVSLASNKNKCFQESFSTKTFGKKYSSKPKGLKLRLKRHVSILFSLPTYLWFQKKKEGKKWTHGRHSSRFVLQCPANLHHQLFPLRSNLKVNSSWNFTQKIPAILMQPGWDVLCETFFKKASLWKALLWTLQILFTSTCFFFWSLKLCMYWVLVWANSQKFLK